MERKVECAVHLRSVEDAVSREVSVAYAYAVVEVLKGICICHVKVWVPPGVLAHLQSQVRRSYTQRLVFLALSGVTIVVLSRFVAAKLGERVTSDET